MKKRDRFLEAHNKYYALIFGVVYTKIENRADSEDICQEIFVRFYKNLDSIKNPRTWLYGTMRNVILEFYRIKNPNLNVDDVFTDLSVTFVNGFREARIIMMEAIENLPIFEDEENRMLFDYVAVHNFSYSETARELGLTKRKVEYRYRQLVDTILDHLKKKGITNIEDLL